MSINIKPITIVNGEVINEDVFGDIGNNFTKVKTAVDGVVDDVNNLLSGGTIKNELEIVVAKADKNITDLNSQFNKVDTTKKELDALSASASETKVILEPLTQNATTIKNQLTDVNAEANLLNTDLEFKNDTAQTTKSELRSEINNADEKLQAFKNYDTTELVPKTNIVLNDMYCDRELISINHNLNGYPTVKLTYIEYGAGLGGAGDHPAGGGDSECNLMQNKTIYKDENNLTVYVPSNYYFGTPSIEPLSNYQYIVTFTDSTKSILIDLIDRNVEQDIEELYNNVNIKANDNDNNRTTVAKSVTGAINELHSWLDKVNSSLFQNTINSQSNTVLLSKVFEKLNKGEAITICTRGDSVVYGQAGDASASDNRPPLDGHTAYRARVTYPETLEATLREVYGSGKINVINRGFSGDTVTKSYERWKTKCNSDITIITLGINDRTLGIETYINGYRKIIEQELRWNSGVIIMLPTKTGYATDNMLDRYRGALNLLAKEYNCPIIDALEMLKNYSVKEIMPDWTHFNAVGYDIIGKRVASYFIGKSILYPKKVSANDVLLVRKNIDSLYLYANASLVEYKNGVTCPEGSISQAIKITAGGKVHYSFETKEDNLIFIPIYESTSGYGILSLDFEAKQQYNHYINIHEKFPNKIGLSAGKYFDKEEFPDYVDYSNFLTRSIIIPCKGWHTLTIANENVPEIYFQGFKIISLENLKGRNFIERLINEVPITGTLKKGERYAFINPTTHIGCIAVEGGVFGNVDTGVKVTIYQAWISGVRVDTFGSLNIGDRVKIDGDDSNKVHKIKAMYDSGSYHVIEFDGTVVGGTLVENAILRYAEPIIKKYGAIES